jgi:hypothetical protein
MSKKKIYKPGEKPEASGIYEIMGPRGRRNGSRADARQG